MEQASLNAQQEASDSFSQLLPLIFRRAVGSFRHAPAQDKDDLVQETIAICWLWYCRLLARGRNPVKLLIPLVAFALRSVRSGRRLCGTASARDVAGRSRIPTPDQSPPLIQSWHDGLEHNTRSAIPEQASFRIDFPCWLSQQSSRNRDIIEAMTQGERTSDLARRFAVSRARISQLRRQFHRSWRKFHGERVVPNEPQVMAAG